MEDSASAFSQSLTTRLDNIKEQYREELEPLTAQREALQREIAELRETREQFLEESAALSAKNEDLAELNTQLSRHAEQLQETLSRSRGPSMFSKSRTHLSGSPSMSSLATSATLAEVPEETARVVKVTKPEPIEAAPARRFKWYKSSKGPDMANMSTASISKPLNLPPIRNNNQRPPQEVGPREHQFQQHSTMRFTRCELCQEKMWGLQEVRCACEYSATMLLQELIDRMYSLRRRLPFQMYRAVAERVLWEPSRSAGDHGGPTASAYKHSRRSEADKIRSPIHVRSRAR